MAAPVSARAQGFGGRSRPPCPDAGECAANRVGPSNGVDQNYAAASPNDSDLGEQAILKRVESYQPFTLEVGVPFYYTSNVALVDRGRVDDVIIAPVVGITYAPKFQRTLYGEFSSPAAVFLLQRI